MQLDVEGGDVHVILSGIEASPLGFFIRDDKESSIKSQNGLILLYKLHCDDKHFYTTKVFQSLFSSSTQFTWKIRHKSKM